MQIQDNHSNLFITNLAPYHHIELIKNCKRCNQDAEIKIDEESRTDLHQFKSIDSKGDTDKFGISEIINMIKNELEIEQHFDVQLSDIHKRFRSLSV